MIALQWSEGREFDAALKGFLRLLDFSRDIDRNTYDARFRDSGGEILYFLDQNIFELAVFPRQRKGLINRSFAMRHLQRIRPGASAAHETNSIHAQLALLTSEYLLFGELPG